LVQAEAFRFDPLGYMQGLVWRARGLRVRSRNRLSALAGRSPHAYALWIARIEPAELAAYTEQLTVAGAPVLPVIDCSETIEGLDQSLDSLSRAGGRSPAVLVGGPSVPGTERVEHPRELARRIGGECWICPMAPGDRLAPQGLDIYAGVAAASGDNTLIYADDDLIKEAGIRSVPHFKPSWNPELFEYHDYLSGAAIIRVTAEQLTKLPPKQWTNSLVKQAVRQAQPVHLPLVLHHRRTRPEPLDEAKPEAVPLSEAPMVSVIIPTRNGLELLRTCINGLKHTNYAQIEIIVVDNGSEEPDVLRYLKSIQEDDVRVLEMPGPFNFSALNNAAVPYARGELLCFLNNDVEIADPDWLQFLVRQAVRPDRGAVGARLLYPDGTIQHAGVITGVGGGAGHAHRLQRVDDPGYFRRASLPQRVSAVTAACLVVARDKFLAVQGFDEPEFPVAFNDVDLCLKLNARGWQSFYEPRATLIHHESKSRGTDRDKVGRERLAAELAALKRKWNTDRNRDPFHHVHLSPFCEQFVIAV